MLSKYGKTAHHQTEKETSTQECIHYFTVLRYYQMKSGTQFTLLTAVCIQTLLLTLKDRHPVGAEMRQLLPNGTDGRGEELTG